MKSKALGTLIISILLASAGVYIVTKQNKATFQPPANSQPKTNPVTTTPTATKVTLDKQLYSLTDPASLWFIANKHFALPTTYEPNDLTVLEVPLRLNANEQQMKIRKVAAEDLSKLFKDAKTAGLQLEFGSGYRSASYQKTLYDGYVASMGKVEADRSSARPGHSEHQTGLAIDFTRIDGLCHLEVCFGDTAEGKWLVDNAHTYGFILRYTSDKESVTGYMFEPWHYRYVGKELAKQMQDEAINTLEEFFDLKPATDYLN